MPNEIDDLSGVSLAETLALSKIKVREFLSIIIVIIGGVFISWYLFDHVLLHFNTKVTIPPLSIDVSRLVVGSIILAMGVMLMKWDDARYPKL